MSAWIADYVASCQVCARYKAPRHRPYGLLQPLATPDRPWGSISLDFIEGLPPSKGYDSILVIVDRLTKFAILAPTYKMVTAKQTAVLLWGNLVRHFGYPDHMVSDRGRQFISGAWKAFADQMGMKHSLSTAYHPQTDGQTERVNQVVEQYLHMYCNYEQNDWAGLLDTAAFVYNNTVHNSIGVSPFFACYGWNPKAHPDIPQHLGVNNPKCSEYLFDGKERCKYLQEQIREAQRRTVDHYNRRHKDIAFKVGDMVYINCKNWKTRRPTPKLDTRFTGPYPVQERTRIWTSKLKPLSASVHTTGRHNTRCFGGGTQRRLPLGNHCVRGRAPETQVGLSRSSVTIQLCDSYCLGLGLEELVARQLSSCAVTAGGVVVYAIVGFG
ncbi:uncharacterized protein UDID_18148 [Ustilago sp. UG-2017a]|nr:uncharacterized protein UDID_18148 [Ustilago sp. UG-2017a]